MVRRSTLVLIVIFAILVGFAWLFQRYQANKSDNAATATATISLANIYNLNGKQVNGVIISNAAGDKIEFYRDSGSTPWTIVDLPDDQVDSFQIDSITAQLFTITAQETLTQSPPLDSIGLDTPAYTIILTTAEGEQWITNVGSPTPIGSGYYIRIDSSPIVIVDKLVMDDVLNMLSDPPVIHTPTPEITPVTVSATQIETQVAPTP